MGWFGKIVGGTLGFVLGGPIGAGAGATLGHFLFDEKNDLSHNERAQASFFVSLFSMLAKMAKADGVVTMDEVKVVDNYAKNDLGLDVKARKFASRIFNNAKNSDSTFEEYARFLTKVFRDEPSTLLAFIDILFRVAKADGKLHPNEERLLRSAQKIFGISDRQYSFVRERYFPTQTDDKYYSILNCTPQSSDEEIKKSYRKLALQYHPDKITSKGLPEEFAQYASNKFKEINDAYDHIKKERKL